MKLALILITAALGIAIAEDQRAVIVVTGMRVQANETRDLTVAEGATVTLTPKKGEPRTKKTAAFERAGRRGTETYFTADFAVDLDATYDIAMTFRDGTVIRVPDYRLPASWKTHFSYHSTRGTKSPSSILRRETDRGTNLSCYVYALWPVASYEAMVGRKISSRSAP